MSGLNEKDAELADLRKQRDELLAALKGEVNTRGCVRGCPHDSNRDAAHNFRCTTVRVAIANAEKGSEK